MTGTNPATRALAPCPSRLYAWFVVGVLTLCYINSFIDRQILNLLVEPIKKDLQISDLQISLLQGLSFALFYSIAGIPIARVADSTSRRWTITVGLFFWSCMTCLCGLVRGFWMLFMARVGVGVGEASLSPAAYSMITDYFPPEKVTRAISVYTGGSAIGAGLAYIIGGSVVDIVSAMGTVNFPLVGELQPWQAAFISVGLPGFLLVIILFAVREPRRRGVIEVDSLGKRRAVPVGDTARFLRVHRWTYGLHFLGFSTCILLGYALLAWTPTFLIRTYGWSASQVGIIYGSIVLVCLTAGIVGAGWIADWMRRRGYADANLRVVMIGCLLFTPLGAASMFMPEAWMALALIAPATFFWGLPHGVGPAALQPITPNQMRAQVSALYMFTVTIIGMGLGPVSVALLTDLYFRDPLMLRYSVAIVCAVAAPLAAVILWRGLRPYRESLASANAGWPGSGFSR